MGVNSKSLNKSKYKNTIRKSNLKPGTSITVTNIDMQCKKINNDSNEFDKSSVNELHKHTLHRNFFWIWNLSIYNNFIRNENLPKKTCSTEIAESKKTTIKTNINQFKEVYNFTISCCWRNKAITLIFELEEKSNYIYVHRQA